MLGHLYKRKLPRIFLPQLARFLKSFFHEDFSTSYFYYIISFLQTVAWNGVVNKLEADSLMNKEKLKKGDLFWCNLLRAISTDLLQIKMTAKSIVANGELEASKEPCIALNKLYIYKRPIPQLSIPWYSILL